MEYLVSDKKYSLSYIELRDDYRRFCDMTDSEFKEKLLEAIHFVCVVGWFKELPNDITIGDEGIIHELIHYLLNPDEPLYGFSEIRVKFGVYLKLV